MITTACWNIRGLNLNHKQDEVKALVFANKVSLLGLVETKVRSPKHLDLARNLLPGWKFFFNYSCHRLGRIWVAWDPLILSVSLLVSTTQLMHVSVRIIQTDQMFLSSFVYGLNEASNRAALWDTIRSLSSSIQIDPWVVLGDFNVVRFTSEKLGRDVFGNPAMEAFNDCCYAAELEDIKYVGHHFTWSNKSSGRRMKSRKLDRALAHSSWLSTFPNSEVLFAPPGISDHSPIILRTGIPLPKL